MLAQTKHKESEETVFEEEGICIEICNDWASLLSHHNSYWVVLEGLWTDRYKTERTDLLSHLGGLVSS